MPSIKKHHHQSLSFLPITSCSPSDEVPMRWGTLPDRLRSRVLIKTASRRNTKGHITMRTAASRRLLLAYKGLRSLWRRGAFGPARGPDPELWRHWKAMRGTRRGVRCASGAEFLGLLGQLERLCDRWADAEGREIVQWTFKVLVGELVTCSLTERVRAEAEWERKGVEAPKEVGGGADSAAGPRKRALRRRKLKIAPRTKGERRGVVLVHVPGAPPSHAIRLPGRGYSERTKARNIKVML